MKTEQKPRFECSFVQRNAKGQPILMKNGEPLRGFVASDNAEKIAAVFEKNGGRL